MELSNLLLVVWGKYDAIQSDSERSVTFATSFTTRLCSIQITAKATQKCSKYRSSPIFKVNSATTSAMTLIQDTETDEGGYYLVHGC